MTPDNSLVNHVLTENSCSRKDIFEEDDLIEKHELVGQLTEFGTANPDIFTIVEDEKLAEQPDPLVPVAADDVAFDSDQNRPHNKSDDSAVFIDGAMQATTKQLCLIKSVRWAANLVGLNRDNPAHTRTQVTRVSYSESQLIIII